MPLRAASCLSLLPLLLVQFFFVQFSFVQCKRSGGVERGTEVSSKAVQHGSAKVRVREITSEDIAIEGQYASMRGPEQRQRFYFTGDEDPQLSAGSELVKPAELAWLTKVEVELLDENNELAPIEHLCHSNLNFPYMGKPLFARHKDFGGASTTIGPKFVDLVQGQTSIEFPKGFAVPLSSRERLFFYAMLINSKPVAEPFKLKWRLRMHYFLDSELKSLNKESNEAIKPLAYRILHVRGPGGYYHWNVPPGRHQYRHVLKKGLALPHDTTLHYISMHLHAHAESLELRDLITGKSIFKGEAESFADGRGIEKMSYFSSEEGIPVRQAHRYELVSVYNNTTDKPIDAMAVMYLYFHDKKIKTDSLQVLEKVY